MTIQLPQEMQPTDMLSASLTQDTCAIIEQAQRLAYQSVNVILIKRNWLLGMRITKELLNGGQRAEYGTNVMESLSSYLQERFGKGFDRSSLYKYIRFAESYSTMFRVDNEHLENVDTLWIQSKDKKVDTPWTQSPDVGCVYNWLTPNEPVLLSWSHYRELILVEDTEARKWYEQEAKQQTGQAMGAQVNIAINLLNLFLPEIQDQSLYQQVVQLRILAERGVITVIAKRLQRMQKDMQRGILNHDDALSEIIEMAKKYNAYYLSCEELKQETESEAEIILSESFK